MIGVISFPGTNCEEESKSILEKTGIKAQIFRWNENTEILKNLDGYLLAGGFSFEDRGRSGVIASTFQIIEVLREASKIGKPIIGICNGAQILVESGLVTDSIGPRISLSENKRIDNKGNLVGTGYYNTWTYLKVINEGKSIFNNFKSNIFIPLAHGEGRFLIPKEEYKNINISFKYCDKKGKIINKFPINPNGSDKNIAGISNKRGNVLALMPHPERSLDGDKIFNSLKKFLEKRKFTPLEKFKNSKNIKIKKKEKFEIEIYTKLIITDNEAISIQNALSNNLGIDNLNIDKYKFVGIKKIDKSKFNSLENLIYSGEFANFEKETLIMKYGKKYYLYGKGKKKTEINNFKNNGINVRDFDDIGGISIKNHLKKFGIKTQSSTGKYWIIDNKEILKKIEKVYILANPISQFIEK